MSKAIQMGLAKVKAVPTGFRNACIGFTGLGLSGLALADIDTTTVNASLDAAQASGEGVGSKVIAVVAGLVVVGVIIAIVRKV